MPACSGTKIIVKLHVVANGHALSQEENHDDNEEENADKDANEDTIEMKKHDGITCRKRN